MIRKKAIVLLSVLLSLCCASFSFAADSSTIPGTLELPYSGLLYTPPEAFRNTTGQLIASGETELLPGIQYTCWYYCAIPEERIHELYNNPDVSLIARPLFYAFSIGKGMKFENMNAMLGNTLSEEYAHEIGKLGKHTFYLYMEDPDPEFAIGLDASYAEEYTSLAVQTDQLTSAFSFREPISRYADIIGTKVEFTTTDLDGQPISSADLFARSEVTMLNIWATWCGPCVGELAELQKIHLGVQEKSCGVAGLLADTDVDAARRLISENGVTYPIIAAPDNINSLFPLIGYPTTFFIGRDGTILDEPIVGAYVNLYEIALDSLLNSQK